MTLSNKLKSDIFSVLLEQEDAFSFATLAQDGFLSFLSEIWNLRAMPSEDGRFKDAYDDIYQHTVNNDDWEIKYLFLDRLRLLNEDKKFILFMEVFLHSPYRKTVEDALKYQTLLNGLLKEESLSLVIIGYNERNNPLFTLMEEDKIDHPVDLIRNQIPFYVTSSNNSNIGRFDKHGYPREVPCFLLVRNYWNDYNYLTSYSLTYYNEQYAPHHLGPVKIMARNIMDTDKVIDKEFTILSKDFCSLGQTFEYYSMLQGIFGDRMGSVFFALKDASFFSEIGDKFDHTSGFKNSLIRTDNAERLYREARARLYGVDLQKLYQFSYKFTPKYSNNNIKVDFKFNDLEPLPNRIFAIIGKNGTGKTQLITSLPLHISKGKHIFFHPQAPVFSKVIAVSYSIFDKFEVPRKTSEFNYVYCGLQDENGELRTERGQMLKFHNTWKKIQELERLEVWRKILTNFIEEGLLDSFIKRSPGENQGLYFDQNGFTKARSHLSSGQSIILYIISEIVSNIRLDSLLLFDEPETHLHPNAITQLMNTIADLVHEFQSYCIIATHSPLLIQELFSKNVFVLERHKNIPSIRRIGLESFGENLSTLTEEVFGNRSVPKYYQQLIDELVEEFKEYDKVLEVMQKGNLPLSLNARLYLRSKTVEG